MDEGKRSRHTNAYFTGIGKAKRIVLFDTLMESHAPEEILSVLAHEIGHWEKRHFLKQFTFTITISLAAFCFVYRVSSATVLYKAFGLAETPLYSGLFLVYLCLSLIGFFGSDQRSNHAPLRAGSG